MLFDLLTLTADEKEQYLAETSSAVKCVASAKIWADKRDEISKTLKEFYTREELVVCTLCLMLSCKCLPKIQKLVPDTQTRESDYQEAQFHDDKSLLEEMRTQIKGILKDPNEYVSMCHRLFLLSTLFTDSPLM